MREVEQIGIGCDLAPFDVEQFRKGMNVEPEHGPHDLVTNVTDDDPDVTGRRSRSRTRPTLVFATFRRRDAIT